MTTPKDSVDGILDQWGQLKPDLDSSGMAVALRIHFISGVLQERLKGILEPAGLAPFEYDVLSALRRSGRGGLTPTDLCRTAQLTSGAMTNRLDRLEERDLVRRRVDPKDRRSLRVSLTARGRKTVDGILGARMFNARACLEGLTRGERAELVRLLRKVSVGLAEPSAPGA